MIESVNQKLSEMTAARLVKIVLAALDTMGETEQINFVAKYIDARTSLERLGEDNPEVFLDEVEVFCLACLNGEYYSDESDIEEYFSSHDYRGAFYDDDWDYDEYYSNTEWVKSFSRLFKLSMMYIRSGDSSTGYEANARLLSCLHEMESSDSFLGTDEPMSYISVDWYELFTLHCGSLFQYHTDTNQAIERAFRCWMNFGDPCAEGFLSNVKDLSIAERIILNGLKDSSDWAYQCQCFKLLAQLYARLERDFDKASQAKALVSHNEYFYLFVVEGLCEQKDWQSAVETAAIALERIPMPASDPDWPKKRIQQGIRVAIQTKLAESYENLADFTQAYETARHMFIETPSFDRYKLARDLSEKGADVSVFLTLAEEQLKQHNSRYGPDNLLRNFYSYEGEIQKMIDLALSQKIDRNYYDRKYTALSLIYRALKDVDNVGDSLSEYLTSVPGQDGIADMLNPCDDTAQRSELLLQGADLLRGIIAFHIAAANRSRYAKAAYYMCVIRDIFVYLKQENEFKRYFNDVMMQNSRRPALRDEMSIVYGKGATMVKK